MGSTREKIEKVYDCPICGEIRTVEFEVSESGEGGEVVTTRESVVDYGECKAALQARNRHHPSRHDLATCPIFRNG